MGKIKDVLTVANGEVGIKEMPAGSNCVKYNDEFYQRKVSGPSYPWCATFVSWVFAKVDPGLITKSASCAFMGNAFKAKKQWYTIPRVGDVVFYKFSGSSRWTNHTGIVIKVEGRQITTIEGNTAAGNDANGGQVQIRTRTKGIVGYGRPDYEDADKEWPSITYGCLNRHVGHLQPLLHKNG